MSRLSLLLLALGVCSVGAFEKLLALQAAKKGDGFDGFGTPDPFNQNDDDQVDQGEPNAPLKENPDDDANMVSEDEEDDDDSFVQVGAKKAKKGDGFDGFGTPHPFNQNDDDSFVQVGSKKAKKGDGFDGF